MGGHYSFAEERRLIWDLLKDKDVIAQGLEEDGYESAYEAVKRLNESFNIAIDKGAGARAELEALRQENRQKDEQIAALENENTNLSRLRENTRI